MSVDPVDDVRVYIFIEFTGPEMRDAHQQVPVSGAECPGMPDALSSCPVNESHIAFIDDMFLYRFLYI